MTDNFAAKVESAAHELGLELGREKIEQLFRYYEMMVEKNKVMNLTAITEENEVITKHIVDSLSIAKYVDVFQKKSGKGPRVIDIGTGAGLPGMVLKIAFPEVEMTLFDSLRKRLNFLDEAIAELKLEGISTVHGRAEDFGRDKKYRETYDMAVSRAVANMSSLSEYCIPFVKKGGIFAAYKTAESEEEIKAAGNAIKKLGGGIEQEYEFVLPDSDIERKLVIVRKSKNTPAAYPRKAGVPSKEPLK